MFFYVSLALVIVAAITLVIGLLSSGLPLVIISIASSFCAGVFLILTVMRDRPRAEGSEAAPSLRERSPASRDEDDDEDAEEYEDRDDGFPIADYDDLKVGEIVPLLPELDDDELDVVREREESGRARATILGRIDELLAESDADLDDEPAPDGDIDDVFPIADYDDLKVGEIVPLLPELDDDELDVVREREAAGRARASILAKIDELLGEEFVPPAPVKATVKAPARKTPAKKAPAKKAPAKASAAKKTAAPSSAKKAAKKTAAPSSAKKAAAKKTPAKKTAAKKAPTKGR